MSMFPSRTWSGATFAARTAVELALALVFIIPVGAGTVAGGDASRASLSEGFEPPACTAGAEIFNDVPAGSPFCPWIEELANRGVVAGCGGGAYCPGSPVSRAQMSVFLLKTLEGSGYLPPPCTRGGELFDDVPAGHTFCRWIEELAGRGITAGCGGGDYCPGSPVTRAQMSVFLLKTFVGTGFQPPPCVAGAEMFNDVPAGNPFCPWIEELARRGITSGCTGSTYCPGRPVNRAQMAVFVLKALEGPAFAPAAAPASAPDTEPESSPPAPPTSDPASTPPSPPDTAPESTATSPPTVPDTAPDTAPESTFISPPETSPPSSAPETTEPPTTAPASSAPDSTPLPGE